jgi:hypothetical protein
MVGHGRARVSVGKVTVQEHLDDWVREVQLVSLHDRKLIVQSPLCSCQMSVDERRERRRGEEGTLWVEVDQELDQANQIRVFSTSRLNGVPEWQGTISPL